jgi:DNA repair protein RadB
MVEDSRNKISSGNYDLNKWLFGGYDRDVITALYGNAGSGKSNMCMMVAVSQARKGNKVIFIDTEGGFSVERIKQISSLSGEEFQKLLENIILLKPTSFEEQWNAFGVLLKELKKDIAKKIGLIIVDGMTMLYRLELAEARKEENERTRLEKIDFINSRLAKQMRLLAEIARKENIPIVVTNQVYGDFLSEEDFKSGKERTYSMVGGDILKYWGKCLIEIKNDRGKRKLILKKHRSLPEKELEFEITNDGIRKRGWL